MIKLSVVIITYNEEKCIKRCLESVKEIADEILVVDSFSTDKTKDICKAFGTHFIENKFEGHIQQKNFAAKQATYNYVLSIDADEVLSDELKENVKNIKNNFTSDGYFFKRLNNYCGHWINHSGWYPDKKLRLWDRRKGQWGGENPHDKFEMQPDSKITYLKGNLLHYTYHSIQQHLIQMDKFTEIAAQAAFKKGRKAPLIKIVIYPFWKFIRDYFINLGFLDGYYGFVICSISSHSTFIKYVKIRELHQNKNSLI